MTLSGALTYRWMTVLILALVPAGVVEGQRTEISGSAGPQLSNNHDDRFGSARGRLEMSIQRPLVSRLYVRGGVAASRVGPPPCPGPPRRPGSWVPPDFGRWVQPPAVGQSLEGHLDIGLPLAVGKLLSLEPYAGTGVRYLTRGETDDLLPGGYALSSSARLFASGGATVYAPVTQSMRVFARLRISRHFMGTQTLHPRDGASIEGEMPDLDTASLTAGIALRL